jgi:hypothetical protein
LFVLLLRFSKVSTVKKIKIKTLVLINLHCWLQFSFSFVAPILLHKLGFSGVSRKKFRGGPKLDYRVYPQGSGAATKLLWGAETERW